MTAAALFIAALILLPAVGLAIWAWFTMVRVEEELSAIGGFEGIQFEIGSQAAHGTQGARWPIPG